MFRKRLEKSESDTEHPKREKAKLIIILFFILLVLVGVGGYLGCPRFRYSFQKSVHNMASLSTELSDEEAVEAEKILARNPEDLMTRVDLIRYYYWRSINSPDRLQLLEKRGRHVLWMIAHHPDSEYAGSAEAHIHPDEPYYAEAKALWLQKAAEFGGSIVVLSNAADALRDDLISIARDLAARALKLKPNDVKLHELFADSYAREMKLANSPRERRAAAKKALETLEVYESMEPNQEKRRLHYLDLVSAAYESDDLLKAKRYAADLLAHEVGRKEPDGYAINAANTVLGLIALRDGDVEEAKRRLHASVTIRKSFALSLAGPRMSLASELLYHHENDAVVSHLNECSRIWPRGAAKIRQWELDIQAGIKPNFGENLHLWP
jgi:hypothetical protein